MHHHLVVCLSASFSETSVFSCSPCQSLYHLDLLQPQHLSGAWAEQNCRSPLKLVSVIPSALCSCSVTSCSTLRSRSAHAPSFFSHPLNAPLTAPLPLTQLSTRSTLSFRLRSAASQRLRPIQPQGPLPADNLGWGPTIWSPNIFRGNIMHSFLLFSNALLQMIICELNFVIFFLEKDGETALSDMLQFTRRKYAWNWRLLSSDRRYSAAELDQVRPGQTRATHQGRLWTITVLNITTSSIGLAASLPARCTDVTLYSHCLFRCRHVIIGL